MGKISRKFLFCKNSNFFYAFRDLFHFTQKVTPFRKQTIDFFSSTEWMIENFKEKNFFLKNRQIFTLNNSFILKKIKILFGDGFLI